MAAGTFAIGSSVLDIPVRALTPGPSGNTSSNTIVEVVDSVGFPVTVTNPAPFLSGLSEETPEARRERFRLYIGGLSRGTKIALEFASRSVVLTDEDGVAIERVAAVLVREPYQDDPDGLLGRVEVYIDNGSGTPSPALLQKVDDVAPRHDEHRGRHHPGLDRGRHRPQRVRGHRGAGRRDGHDHGVGRVRPADYGEPGRRRRSGPTCSACPSSQSVAISEIIAAAMVVDGVVDIDLQDPVENVHVTYSQSVEPGLITVHTVGA